MVIARKSSKNPGGGLVGAEKFLVLGQADIWITIHTFRV